MVHYFTHLTSQMKSKWEKAALCDYKQASYSYKDIATIIEKYHICFRETGINKGDRIALCAKNSAKWGISFLASNTYEAVTVPILADFRPEDACRLIDHSEAKVLFTEPEKFDKMDIAMMPNLRYVFSLIDQSLLWCCDEQTRAIIESRDAKFEELYPNGMTAADVNYPTDNLDKLAVINYTSGTTSAPKGVMLRYDSFTSNVMFALDHIPVHEGDQIVSMLPMAHMYGFMFEFLYPLCGGATVYFLGKAPTPQLLVGALKDVKPYLLITVPLVMEKIFKSAVLPAVSKPAMKVLLAIPGVNKVILGKIRQKLLTTFGGNIQQIIMGGAALNPEVEKWFKKIGLPYTVGYGMTEAAPLMAYSYWTEYAPQSCGRAVDRVEVRIDSPDPINVVGEIQARGTNIMSGYYKNPEATEAAFTEDGWMRTGDLGVLDAKGNIFIRGRIKNMLLSSNGQNIYPEEIEAVMNNMPYVQESVVVDRGGKLVALVYLDEIALRKDAVSDEAIKGILAGNLAEANKQLPIYSKLTSIERMPEPFEKTPKMSIKRFMYK